MHNVQHTKWGVPQARSRLTQLSSALLATSMYGYRVLYRTVDSKVDSMVYITVQSVVFSVVKVC